MSKRLLPAAVFLIALVALFATRGSERLPVPRAQATNAAKADDAIDNHLATYGYDHQRVTRLDDRLDRVTFFDGSRIRAEAAVDAGGHVEHSQVFRPGAPRYGSKTSDSLWLLALLALCFLVATATRPLLSMRNLDVLALIAFAVPIVAGDHQLLGLSVLSGYPLLAYLGARCAWRATHDPAAPAAPLLELHARYLGYGIAGAAILLAAIAVGSPGAIDVGFASSAGATLLLHGTLPYGHMPAEVLHGDTYPLLNYVLYIPAAAIAPVRDAFDDTGGAVLIGLAAALVTALSLRKPRLVLAWLCFPPVAVAVAAGTNDLLLAAALALALASASRPGRSALALTAGAWIKLAPLALLPMWLARTRGRGAAAAAALSLALIGALVAVGGAGAVPKMLSAMSFQLERGTLQSGWELLGTSWLQHVAQAATVAGIAWATLNARRITNLAAASAAILIALQLSATNWTYLYAVWLFPALGLALLSATPGRATPTTRSRPDRAAD